MADPISEVVDHLTFNTEQRRGYGDVVYRKQARLNIGFYAMKASVTNYTEAVNHQYVDITDAQTTQISFTPEDEEAKVIFEDGAEYHFWFNSGPVYAEDSNLQYMHYRVFTAGSHYLSPWLKLRNGSSINTRIDWKAEDLPDTEHPETDNVLIVEFDTPLQNGSQVYLRVSGTRMVHNPEEET